MGKEERVEKEGSMMRNGELGGRGGRRREEEERRGTGNEGKANRE